MGFELFYDVAYIIGESFVSLILVIQCLWDILLIRIDGRDGKWGALCYRNLSPYRTYGSVSDLSSLCGDRN
jgi:hypothetical protein